MILFENDYYALSLDTEIPCLEWIGKKFIPSAEFRESEIKSLEYFMKFKLQYPALEWFVDTRNIGPVSPTDTQWVAEEILPQFAKAKLTKEAFVVPITSLGKMAVKNYSSKAGEIVEIQVFASPKEAKEWLKLS